MKLLSYLSFSASIKRAWIVDRFKLQGTSFLYVLCGLLLKTQEPLLFLLFIFPSWMFLFCIDLQYIVFHEILFHQCSHQ